MQAPACNFSKYLKKVLQNLPSYYIIYVHTREGECDAHPQISKNEDQTMTKRFKLPILLLLITTLVVCILASCTSVGIASVQIKDDCNYKTEYVIGEELDLTGLELVVTRTDGETYTVVASEAREHIKVLNFKTDKVTETLNVVIEYKGVATTITVSVSNPNETSAKHIVTFMTGEGQKIDPIGVGDYASITAPNDPVREGYVFDGWYKESTYDNLWNFNTEKVIADTTLYAKWAKLYPITFHYSDEYNKPKPDPVTKYVKEGDTLTNIPTLPPVEGMKGRWDRESFTNVYSPIEVHAIYEHAKYTVSFYYMDADGVTPIVLKEFEVQHGTRLAEAFTDANDNGLYDQGETFTDANGNGIYDQVDEIKNLGVPQLSPDGTKHFSGWSYNLADGVVSNLNIEARYTTNKYDVTFYRNCSSDDQDVHAVIKGITYNNPVNAPGDPDHVLNIPGDESRYAFDGWYTDRDGVNKWNFDTSRVTGETALYAKWTNLYYVRFYNEDNSLYDTIQVRAGESAPISPLPTKVGHVGQWFIGQDPLTSSNLTAISTDLEVHVKFSKIKYMVTFYNEGSIFEAENFTNPQEVEYDEYAVMPETAPTRLGYTFLKWDGISQDEDGAYETITSDTNVYASFKPNSYVVEVYTNHGDNFRVEANYDDVVGSTNLGDREKLNPTYVGYHFEGWYTDSAFTKSWQTATEIVNADTILANTNVQTKEEAEALFNTTTNKSKVVLSLYAKWSKIHTIQLYNDDNYIIGTLSVINGRTINVNELPQIEEKVGMNGAWRIRGQSNAYDASAPVLSDLALEIFYVQKTYTVNFYSSVGTISYTVSGIPHGEKITVTIPDPVIVGKVFEGWDKPLDQIITEDTDYMAIFSPVYYEVTWAYDGRTYAVTQVEHGKPATYPAGVDLPIREGYTLSNWVAVTTPGNTEGFDINNVTQDLRANPEWTINTYSIEFINRATNERYKQLGEYDKQTKKHGSVINVEQIVQNPQEMGKDFMGWTIGSLNVKYNEDLASWVIDSSYGEDALHSLGSTYKATLIVRGNKFFYSIEDATTIAEMIERNDWDSGRIIEIVATESGWMRVSNSLIITDAKSLAFDGDFIFVMVDNSIFYSNFEVSRYEISYETNTDEAIAPSIYPYGASSVAPKDLSKENYVFVGWYTEPEYKNKYNFGVEVISDLVLYARWEEKKASTEGLVYTLNESGTAYSLTGIDENNLPSGKVVVANFYVPNGSTSGLPVESIGAEAFAGNNTITEIELPSTLVNIGPGAFMNMSQLESIVIPESIRIIPDNAFSGATNLRSVTFGENSTLEVIGKNAFAKNSSLKYSKVNGVESTFVLPQSLVTIESGAFFNCTAFTEIEIPASVLSIGDNAFAGANNLRYAVFNRNTPANLGENAFQNYTSLQHAFKIYTPNVTLYTSNAANANWKLLKEKIYDVNNITKSGNGKYEWAYNYNTNGNAVLVQYLGEQKEITIPKLINVGGNTVNVAELGNYAFDGSVISVSFDDTIGIMENTFASAESLEMLSISYTGTNAINARYLYNAYSNTPNLHTLNVTPNTTISELFGGAAPTSLTKVNTIAGANNVMADGFLANCASVKEVVLNGRTETIGARAFLNCTSLVKIVFDVSVYSDLETIGDNAFMGAISLEQFEIVKNGVVTYGIPETVITIGADAFEGTAWLSDNSRDMVIVGNGILYHYNGSANIVSIPSSITSITPGAFENNVKIMQVYVSDIENSKLESIGASAFANCVNLESITIPQSVNYIGANAFEGDKKLATIVYFGSNIPAYIGGYAFNNVHDKMKVYTENGASDWSNFNNEKVDNLTVFESDWVWVYGKAKEGDGIMIVKALGSLNGDSTYTTIPERLNAQSVNEIADYALPRVTKKLDYSTYVANVGDNPFGGITEADEITLRNSTLDNNISQEVLAWLFENNSNVSVLNTMANTTIKELIGGTLPQNVKTVNILADSFTIASGFLEDNEYVENITITVFDKDGDDYVNPAVVNLEDTLDLSKEHRFASIGAKAFRNTAWMDAYEGEYVIILGGNLVDYKGVNRILDIPESVVYINGNIFENDAFIEVVNVPASVKKIGDHAFDATPNLTKIFFKGSEAPAIEPETFEFSYIVENVEIVKGLEIFVPQSAIGNYSSNAWAGISTVGDEGIVFIKNAISSNTFEEYIINATSKTLLLARKYRVSYSGGLVSEIEEYSAMTAPISVMDSANGTTYNVEKLGNNAFMSVTTSLVLNINTAVNEYTFNNLGNVDKVTILSSYNVKDIINDSDKGLVKDLASRKLTSQDIVSLFGKHNVRSIAFDGTITLSELVERVNVEDMASLENVEILDGILETKDELLKGWEQVTKVSFPTSITKVGVNSLEDTAWYQNYASTTSGNDFVVVGGSLLYKYKGTSTSIVIPNLVRIINTGAFSNYDKAGDVWSSSVRAKEISFGTGSEAHTILDNAFNGCEQLISITFPLSMSNISASAFTNTGFKVVDDMLIVSMEGNTGNSATLIKYFGSAENVTIPANVEKIAEGAFEGNKTIKQVSFPTNSSLYSICKDAFKDVATLVDINIPSSVMSIGKDAFYGTLWLGNQLHLGYDVIIGGKILYQRVTTSDTFSLDINITSVVEGALTGVKFEIDEVLYMASDEVAPKSITISNGAYLPQKELYMLLSQESVTSLRTNGQVTLSGLIGSDEPLPNITSLSFLTDTKSITARYAENWTNVTEVNNIPSTVVEIGENAFRGTTWFENLNDQGFNFAGSSKVIIKYVGNSEEIVIGGGYETVTGFTADTFQGNETIKKVTFGQNSMVSKIPAGAFRDCVNLESVEFNSYVKEFGEDAFQNTAWLRSYGEDFVIVDGALIEYLGEGGEIVIPQEVTKIYPYVFRGNDTITSVTFHENCLISEIGENIFRDCVNLEELVINEHIVMVDRTAVEGTKWLSTLRQSSDPVLYYENAYYGIKRAVLYVGTRSDYTMPNTTTEIVENTFKGVTTLTQIIFAERGKLTAIPDGAFEGCIALSSVTLVDKITEIGENAFYGTPWFSKQSDAFVVKNGILIKYNGDATSVVIPEGVTLIEKGVFDGKGITSIDMSNTNVETILEGTFSGLSTLETVVFSSATTYVGEGAFSGTKYLSDFTGGLLIVNDVVLIAYKGSDFEITIPQGVKYVNSDVFQGNLNILEVTFTGEIELAPYAFANTGLLEVNGIEFVVSAGKGAFSGTYYELNELNNDGFVIADGYLVDYNGVATDIVIPQEVRYIPEGVFTGNKNITSVDFSLVDGPLTIEANAFRNAVNLRNVVLSDNIESLGDRAFYNTAWMDAFASALIISPNGKLLALVREDAVISIPSNVTSFAKNVFTGNTNITGVHFATGSSLTIPEDAFNGCTSLLNVTFPDGAFEIGKNAFQNTAWYKSEATDPKNNGFVVVKGKLIGYEGSATVIEIPAKVTYLYEYVFAGNENITALLFASGSGLTAIRGNSFAGCTQLVSVVFDNSNVVELEVSAFAGTPWLANLEGEFIVVNHKLLAYVGNGGHVVIPSSVGSESILSISQSAFQGNVSITALSFGLGSFLNAIPKDAFNGCVNLEKVILPEEIEYVGKDAFKGTKWLENMLNGIYDSEELGRVINDAYVLDGKMLFMLDNASETYTLPEGIARITRGAFEGSGVVSLVIPSVYDITLSIDSGALDSVSAIYVEDSKLNEFRNAWMEYGLKIKALSSKPE